MKTWNYIMLCRIKSELVWMSTYRFFINIRLWRTTKIKWFKQIYFWYTFVGTIWPRGTTKIKRFKKERFWYIFVGMIWRKGWWYATGALKDILLNLASCRECLRAANSWAVLSSRPGSQKKTQNSVIFTPALLDTINQIRLDSSWRKNWM